MKLSRMTFAAAALAAGIVAVSPAAAEVGVNIIIDAAPPAPRYEAVPPPRHGHVFVPGYWAWEKHRYVWIPAQWVRERPGYVWVPAHWVPWERRHRFLPGHWEVRHARPPHRASRYERDRRRD